MLNQFAQLPLFFAQAYGQGTYNSLRYQDTTVIGPITLPFALPSVGTASMAIASCIALGAGIAVFMMSKKHHELPSNQKDS